MAVSPEELLRSCAFRHRDWLAVGVYVDSLEDRCDENVLGWRLLIQEEQWPSCFNVTPIYYWLPYHDSLSRYYEPLRMEATLPRPVYGHLEPGAAGRAELHYVKLHDALTAAARAFTLAAREGWKPALPRPRARALPWPQVKAILGP